MAKRVSVEMIDDLDGESTGAETLRFAFDGVSYEIDLVDSNKKKMIGDLQVYIDAARVTGGKVKKKAAATAEKKIVQGDRNTKVREWARGQGLNVADSGRIPRDVQRAYDRAHGEVKAG